MMTIYIYGLRDPLTDEIRYIGKTNNIKARYSHHIACNDVNKHKINWILSLKELKLKPELVILEKTNEQEWEEREKYWIKHGRDNGWRLTNISDGGMNNYMANENIIDKELLYPYVDKENLPALYNLSPEQVYKLAVEMIKESIDLMNGYFTGKTDGMEAYKVSRDFINMRLSL